MYGTLPAPDEAEIVLFGPGYGEAIAVHVGNHSWVVVDSCIDPDNKLPASLHYLRSIGVQPGDVKAIVASHWHDDHVRGLATVAEAFPNAEFFISSVFSTSEAKAFVYAYGSEEAQPQAKGARELYKIVSKRPNIKFTQHRVIVLENSVGPRNVRVLAFSPGTHAQAKALAHFTSYLPRSEDDPITHAPELKPNLEAIVLHVDFGDEAVLLGSDLENVGPMGWGEIVADSITGTRRRASVYKVAHHGSKTGDLADIWARLLGGSPVAIVTPFNNGAVHLPTSGDRARIKRNAHSAYITSTATRKAQLPPEIEKRMGAMSPNLTPVNTAFGAIRLRRKLGSSGWNVDLFGRAGAL